MGKWNNFVKTFNLPQISEKQQARLSFPLQSEEIIKTMEEISLGKTSGSDGLLIEFYQSLKEILPPKRLHIYEDVLKKVTLPPTMNNPLITLLLKLGKYVQRCYSCKPSSLINTDIKILLKILVKRLKK
uniref:Reverse transcriptase domain-containing protein n=1 Tax=Gopherus agassizii TaxID=38772 RepID=A0A452H4L5_9SAUR